MPRPTEALRGIVPCILALLLWATPARGQSNHEMTNLWRPATAGVDSNDRDFGIASQRLVSLDTDVPRLDRRITIRVGNVTVEDALRRIARESGLKLIYQESVFSSEEALDLNLEQVTVLDALHEVIKGTGLRLELTPNGFLIVTRKPAGARQSIIGDLEVLQTGVISGRVTDAKNGEGMPGAKVMIAESTEGTATDLDGNYRLENLEPGTYTIRASYVGYATQEVADVPVTADQVTTLNFALEEDVAGLAEVIVVGYGTQRRQNVTGAIASVDPAEFETEPVIDVSTALQGRVPGVEIVRNGGAPGAESSIRIRGTGTVNDAGPLIVIDGVPSSSGSIDDVDPDNIESIELLKDASAAAIYGNRAGNGVVLITTKRGQLNQGLKVSFKSSVGTATPTRTVDVLDAGALAELKRERYVNDGLPIDPIWEVDSLQTQRTNWQNELLDRGTVQDYNLSISGGGDKSAFFIAGSYSDNEGMMKSSNFRRYGLSINSDHNIGRILQVRQNLHLSRTSASALNTLSAQNGVLWSAIRFYPGFPVNWGDGSYSSSQINGEFGDINNPIFTVDTQDQNATENRLLGNVEGQIDLLKGLAFRANVGLDYQMDDGYDFEPIIDKQIRANSRNELTKSHGEFRSLLTEFSLNYNATLARQHEIDAFAGYSVQTFDADNFSAIRMDFSDESPDQRVLSSGNSITGAAGGRTDDALESYISRLNYAFKERYLLTASFRVDGSSKFASENRWGYFPAVSAGWRISEEPFFGSLKPVFNNLKVTAGWGQSGNQSVARLQYLGLFGRGARYSFGGQSITGINLVRLPNPDISWETAEMTNIGLEMAFLNYQLQAKADYFIKNTKNMLLAPPTIGTMGTATVPDVNVGALRNQGVELGLNYFRTVGDFDLSAFGNASFIKNQVVSINADFLTSQTYGRPNQEISRTFEGEPMATFYGWHTDGLYQNQSEIDSDPNIANDPRRADITPGDVRFVDLNGDGLINGDDRSIIGDPNPDVTYGLGMQLGYRGISFNLFFVGAAGVDIYNADRMQGLDPTYPFNMYQETVDRWHGEGTSNSIPKMTTRRANLNHRTSDLFVEPGDFLRLKTMTLGYTLPQNMLARTGVTEAKLYLTAQNLLTFTPYSGMDPELGYSDGNLQRNVDFAQYPQARTWTIGVVVNM